MITLRARELRNKHERVCTNSAAAGAHGVAWRSHSEYRWRRREMGPSSCSRAEFHMDLLRQCACYAVRLIGSRLKRREKS